MSKVAEKKVVKPVPVPGEPVRLFAFDVAANSVKFVGIANAEQVKAIKKMLK